VVGGEERLHQPKHQHQSLLLLLLLLLLHPQRPHQNQRLPLQPTQSISGIVTVMVMSTLRTSNWLLHPNCLLRRQQ
jgi:hypothetical protein